MFSSNMATNSLRWSSGLGSTLLNIVSRNQTTGVGLSYIKHAFSPAEAAQLFLERDQRRLFAPIQFQLPKEAPNQIQLADENPLKKIYLPFFGATATTSAIRYKGEYGIEHSYTTTSTDAKGHVQSEQKTYTTWHNISGSLEPNSYKLRDKEMLIYAGFSYDRPLVENALAGYDFKALLIPFDLDLLKDDALIDPFLKRAAIAQAIFYQRIELCEKSRARSDIRRRVSCSDARVNDVAFGYTKFKLWNFLLPAYILQYPNCPPRIMPAWQKGLRIEGPAPLSILKVSGVAFAVSALVSTLLPDASLTLTLGIAFASSISAGVWAKNRLSWRNSWQEASIAHELNENESISETMADEARRLATHGLNTYQRRNAVALQVDQIYYQILDLDPDQPITEEMVTTAFTQKIKGVHPDRNNTADPEETRALINARNVMLKAINRKHGKLEDLGKRYFSTRRTVTEVKEPPRSVYHPRAGELINAVLVEKNYKKALKLVKEDEVHPDSHDKGENTLLTEAAKMGDLRAIEFSVTTLKASLNSSCDCPIHLTALHYAVMRGHYKAVELLLKLGATPNLINSKGETPLDIAITNGNHDIKILLIQNGARQHNTLEGKTFWQKLRANLIGYGSEERTILLEEKKYSAFPELPDVIYLPPPSPTKKDK